VQTILVGKTAWKASTRKRGKKMGRCMWGDNLRW